ncbi:hypothetical protein [Flavobacterium columnare]|uniref:hypothetical protein n=1 Tax=Flavobacterium columnare TaxID=996 RepID=UPI0013E3DED0|nr:hypothetical protein [Flavobacterium columnare]MCH4828245.1 hypothetical protein [Flavobacterium columnare]MCH4828916.1 hypothetical protein [Flavobacterium columnare]MCH4829812.1 hypothetical protein [Flavobacterium columnare]MCH4831609.1 hypothetical protein [Flavobacterium columnare]MCH4831641.1 hypothetical protein [Flavobacterium columnare]
MYVTKEWLEHKIQELNTWLQQHEKLNHFQYAEKKQNRNYYVSKIIELEELGIKKIKV